MDNASFKFHATFSKQKTSFNEMKSGPFPPHTAGEVLSRHELFNFPNAIYSMSSLASSGKTAMWGTAAQ